MIYHFDGTESPFHADSTLPLAQRDIVPSYGTDISSDTRTKRINFGDGYAQESDDGLNPTKLIVSVTFLNRSMPVITAITNFLRGTGPRSLYDRTPNEPFWWTVPIPPFNDKERRFKCRGVKVSPKSANVATLTAIFEETFEL